MLFASSRAPRLVEPDSWSPRAGPPRRGSLVRKGIQPQKKTVTTLMAGILRSIVQRPPGRLQVFQPSPADHEKYGGDPQHPHKLHIVTRIKSTKRRPYWEKDTIKMLGLEKAHTPQVHKNIPSVNAKLKVVKHLIRIKPLKLPQGLPAEEDMSNMCLKSTGELVRWHLNPIDQEAVKS
ncbi:39S ribosomal protein L30, mitochondrial isoform X3 [Meles meles]|uniref:39S ribosomal protein L30, mitochondrial isoform X3 n=1 Tax=Meles meles TaxID=9662 RepID=UPI001E69B5A4|nr:39S ribosomal protein L30, mitochondrial isoform X3 [Meles meles]